MSAKRPRPAIPVLVHVDNPAEVGSVTVDTSTVEEKMDTVINNQERIYNKIPTSSGGGSADLTTVNEKTTQLAAAIGPASSTSSDDNIFGHVRNLQYAVGDSTKAPSAAGNSVRDLLTAIKQNTASGGGGGGGSADLTTVNEKITTLATAVGTTDSTTGDHDLLGLVNNLRSSIGIFGTGLPLNDTTVRSLLYNMRTAIGSGSATPTLTGTSVRDLLTQIKENTASGGGGGSADLTTVNEKTTSMAAAIGTNDSTSEAYDLLGRVKNLVLSVGDFNGGFALNGVNIRSFLFNLREGIGSSENAPSATGTSVRDLLTAIKQNTASGGGGGGGSADLTTVNEKTTALAAAVGSASDDASTVSVIGLLKSITDKY